MPESTYQMLKAHGLDKKSYSRFGVALGHQISQPRGRGRGGGEGDTCGRSASDTDLSFPPKIKGIGGVLRFGYLDDR